MTAVTVFQILQKPKQWEPCNGCGECCKEEACEISVTILNSKTTPCIALEFDGEKYRCGMVTRPAHYLRLNWTEADIPKADAMLRPMIQQVLGIGTWCDADWRAE